MEETDIIVSARNNIESDVIVYLREFNILALECVLFMFLHSLHIRIYSKW